MKTMPALALFTILTLLFFSCKKDIFCERGHGIVETREILLPTFDAIRVDCYARVTLTEGPEQKVMVSTHPNLFALLNKEVKDHEWRVKFNKCVNNSDMEITITVPSLRSVSLEGAGDISATNTFHADNFNLSIDGSGKINLPVSCNEINVKIGGSGEIYLYGTTDVARYSIGGSGKIKGYDFSMNDARFSISGSGEIEATCYKTLNADISGSGKICYKGTAVASSKISGSGSVQNKN